MTTILTRINSKQCCVSLQRKRFMDTFLGDHIFPVGTCRKKLISDSSDFMLESEMWVCSIWLDTCAFHHREVQTIVLSNIATMSSSRKVSVCLCFSVMIISVYLHCVCNSWTGILFLSSYDLVQSIAWPEWEG